MTARSNLLFLLAGGLAAVLGAVLLARMVPELGRGESVAAAGILFLGALLVAEFVQRRANEAEQEAALDRMRHAAADAAADLASARRDILRLKDEMAHVEERTETRVRNELAGVKGLLTQIAAQLDPPTARPGAILPVKRPPQTTSFAPVNLPQPELTDPEAELATIIRHALEENRIDLYLQPVVSLPQRKTRFYEAYSRLRADDGTMIGPDRYIPLAAQSGLISVIDNLLLFRCVHLVRKLRRRNRNVSFFCNISSFSLNDEAFFDQFVDFLSGDEGLAESLVFEFGADDIQRGGAEVDAKLARLAAMGYRFSLDRVQSLDIDFTGLAHRRFRYIKVDAALMLSPTKQSGASIAVDDLKEMLTRSGIDLIAEKVETERTVVDLLEFGVDFAQGYLFGAPRPAKDDV